MPTISHDTLANVYFRLRWHSDHVTHEDGFYAQNLNLWRDYFPGGLEKHLEGMAPGQTRTVELNAKHQPVPVPHLIQKVERACFKSRFATCLPREGRFYPQGFLCALPGIFPQNIKPFRISHLDEQHFTADLNHPLAGVPLTLEITALEVWKKIAELGGSSRDWLDSILDGPGIKARHGHNVTVFFDAEPLERSEAQPDSRFYETVRKVSHVDSKARELITKTYADLLPGRTRILDLMSSYESHLPDGLRAEVTGLGMNAEEMAANPALTRHVVHDLNTDPALPFGDESFDAVICALSVDYMTRPHAVFREIARVLTPGAPCVMVVSNRWFPNQATNLWTEMHEFERVGFIVECYLQTGQFEQLRTRSERGWPRPQDARDRYYPAIQHSDPVHVVWGTRR